MVYNMQTSGKWLQTGGVWLSTQDEAGVSTVVITLPLATESGLDLASLSYAVKGLIGASELRTALHGEVDDLGITLSWTVGPEWTANAGSMALTLIGSDASGDVVIKWLGNSPVYVVADPIGSNTPAPDVAQQYLAQMQVLLDQAGSGGGGGGSGGGGGEEVYELIDSLTITEENQADRYNFTNEPDGTPYNFKKLMIRIIQADSPVGIALNWYKWDSLAYTNGNQAKYYTVFSLEFLKLGGASMPGTLLCNVYAYTNNANDSIGSGYIRGRGAPLWPFETGRQSQSIDNVCVLATTASSPIPLGTTIEIYGVRM